MHIIIRKEQKKSYEDIKFDANFAIKQIKSFLIIINRVNIKKNKR
jgi:hypothetical protein